MEQGFSKLFKNSVVVYVNSRVEFLYRVGLSLRVDYTRSILEVYREEGKILAGRSLSRGKRSKVPFRGKPTIEGIGKLLSLMLDNSQLTFFSISEVFLNETFTEKVSLTEFILCFDTGKVFKVNNLSGDRELLSQLEPVEELDSLLRLTGRLWKIVDQAGFSRPDAF
ncbi:hypothetical protein BCF55_1020 [Hydrogenivirga caldilitoris]|uniref:Uncharacterized protein n=1 Tax=Hydrogenivirga caldilitoris TaxID=246264 RepID=A0A497XPC9_9AQUI|nr:hypothetical protein [Hydrogenivirga caldilitoris]RLJ70738.1 hypothetical protein BCF55_1020 [Hydrogenivirga caldilitoris]